MRKVRMICILLAACLQLTGCSVLMNVTGTPLDARVRAAREALGLEGTILYDFNAIYMGDALTAFCMPQYRSHEDHRDLRKEALERLWTVPGWHVETLDAEQVTAVMRTLCPGATLFPNEGVSFQAWFCEQDGEYPETIPDSMNGESWTLGFYAMEEGWWLYLNDKGGDMGENARLQQAGPIAISAACQLPDGGPWNMGEITREELIRLMDWTQEEAWPQLYPAAGIVFDRWRWEDRSGGKQFGWNTPAFPQVLKNAGIQDSRDWVLTLYDEETGLQVRYEYKG